MTGTATIEAKGRLGTTVTFDGTTVTISRSGFMAATTAGTGEKRIPLGMISAIQFKSATALVHGYMQFSFSGEVQRSRRQQSLNDRATDENTVQFTKAQLPAFEAIRDAIEAARVQAHNPRSALAAPSVAERIQQLAGLRDQGLISPEEYEAKRAQLLEQL
jgi:hypothetical protein